MAEELSLGDRKAVQKAIEERRETAVVQAWVTHFKASFVKGGGSKSDKRIIVVGQRRIFILARGKVEKEFSLLALSKVTSDKKPEEASLEFVLQGPKGPSTEGFTFQSEEEVVDEILVNCVGAFAATFPGAPESARPKVNVKPESRIPNVEPPEMSLGGILEAYRACADRDDHRPREDIIWDIEAVWSAANVRTFNGKELEQPIAPADFKALMSALKYNSWFTAFAYENTELPKPYFDYIADCLEHNTKLEVLRLEECGMKKDELAKLAEGMARNPKILMNSITLANNAVEDKGMGTFGDHFLAKLKRGLIKLDVSGCKVGGAGMNSVCKALKTNTHMSQTLTVLNLATNGLAGDAGSSLAQFLSNPNQLVNLNIADCQAKLSPILNAMLRGCGELQVLDISGNPMAPKGDSQALAQFVKGAKSLKSLSANNTGATPDMVSEILVKGVAANPMLKGVAVAFGLNKLGVPGARAIAKVAGKLSNIESLDLSENGFGDEGVKLLCKGLCDSKKLLSLNISRNFDGPGGGKKGKGPSSNPQRSEMIDAIALLCDQNENECPLQHLYMSGDAAKNSKVPLGLGPDGAAEVLYAMATNDQLRTLDLSGHLFGDKGAGAAGKMVTTNEVLEAFFWDDNSVGLPGLDAFYSGLRKNTSLVNCPLPITDISNAMKSNPLKITEVVRKIESKLRFNQSPTAKFSSGAGEEDAGEGSGSTFAFLSSAGREEVNKVLFRLKSTGRKPPEWVQPALEDARNQDNIMTDLFGIKDAIAQEAEANMRKGLAEASKAAYPLFAKLKARLVEELGQAAARHYSSLKGDEGKAEIKRMGTNLQFGYSAKDLAEEDFEQVLVAAAGAELANRANQALHGTVTVAADYLYEKLAAKLQEALDDVNADIQSEKDEADGISSGHKTEKGSADGPKKSRSDKSKAERTGSSDKVSDKSGDKSSGDKPSSKPKKSSSAPKEEAEAAVDLSTVGVAESNLEHVTKTRAAAPNRRPPTRVRRPAPPPASAM